METVGYRATGQEIQCHVYPRIHENIRETKPIRSGFWVSEMITFCVSRARRFQHWVAAALRRNPRIAMLGLRRIARLGLRRIAILGWRGNPRIAIRRNPRTAAQS